MDAEAIRKLQEDNVRFREEAERQRKRAQAVEAEKKRADEAVEAERKRADEAVEAEKKRADEAVEAEKKRADELLKHADELLEAEKTRADKEVDKNKDTIYSKYLTNIQQQIPPILCVENDPKQSALGKAAKFDDKVYPRVLRRWTDFPQLHRRRFDMLTTLFGDNLLFPSYNDSKSVAKNLSPGKRRDEQDIRPFIRAYLEVPAMQIVKEFLRRTDDPKYTGLQFQFRNNAHGTSKRRNIGSGASPHTGVLDGGSDSPSPSPSQSHSHGRGRSSAVKRKFSSASTLVPDRWGLRMSMRRDETGEDTPKWESILPGEYKAAHKVRGDDIRSVLGTASPAESFMHDCAQRQRGTGGNDGDVDEQQPPPTTEMRLAAIKRGQTEMTIAEVICQEYHYMIVCGTNYGYVTSGEATVFFMLSPENVDVLLYHFVDHAMPAAPILQPQPETEPINVPAAQLATLVLEALATPLRVSDPTAIDTTATLIRALPHWPSSTPKVQSRLSARDDGDDDNNNNNNNMSWGGGGSSDMSPPPPSPHADGASESSRPFNRSEPPRQKYCMQRCLLGLCHGGPLDPDCPNTPEHAHGERQKTGADGQQLHAITPAELCTMLLEQVTRSLSAGVECLMKYGLFGAIGTLFKITLCAYGYTFVGKGVQDADRQWLKEEAAIYTNPVTQPLQGVLMPVYLGWVELEEWPYMMPSGACVWHFILMSWAGNSLERRVPDEIDDVDDVIDSIEDTLCSHGIFHDDIRPANLAWNKELKQVMVLDFDRATIQGKETTEDHKDCAEPPVLAETGKTEAVKVETDGACETGKTEAVKVETDGACMMHCAEPPVLAETEKTEAVKVETGKTEAVKVEADGACMRQDGLTAEKRKFSLVGQDGAESKRQRM